MLGEPYDYWGKFKPGSDDTASSWLPLLDHMTDVASCFQQLLRQGHNAVFARLSGCEKLDEAQQERLVVLAFLHDLGKANAGFQSRVFEEDGEVRRAGHVQEAAALMVSKHGASLAGALTEANSWFRLSGRSESSATTLIRMLLCSFGHHGRPVAFSFESRFTFQEEYKHIAWSGWRYTDIEQFLVRVRDVMKTRWPKAFECGSEPITITAEFCEHFNGLLTLADWMGSDDREFPYETPERYDDRQDFSTERAKEFMEKIGISRTGPVKAGFEELFGFSANPMQAALFDTRTIH